jgi:flagellar L-ring protein precursor FlgH
MASGMVRLRLISVGLLACVLVSLMTGCMSFMPVRVEVADTAPAYPSPLPPAPPVPSGAIYQAASYRPLFEDHRARLVGDTLTVNIVEKISAVQKSTSSIDKAGSLEGSVTALPALSPGALNRASARGSSTSTFEGKGSTESSNDFSGTITVIVTGVLPNGHLVVAGEKQIGVNDNVDVLRFSGQVDPRSIQAGNAVPSTAIANVRVEQRGRGATAQANTVGWLSRFFLSVMPI